MGWIREILGWMLLQLRFLWKTDHGKVWSVYFHNPSPALFRSLLLEIKRQGYEFISTETLEACIQSGTAVRKKALISFDDGNKEYLDLLPVLEELQVPVTMFIPTEPVETGNYWWDFAGHPNQESFTGLENIEAFKKLEVAQFDSKIEVLKQQLKIKRTCVDLGELKQLASHPMVTIGAHTETHPVLIRCTKERQEKELRNSKNKLKEWLTITPRYLAYPNGDYNDMTLELAELEGYSLGFTTVPGRIDIQRANRLELPRYSVNDEGGYYENLAKIYGVWQRFIK